MVKWPRVLGVALLPALSAGTVAATAGAHSQAKGTLVGGIFYTGRKPAGSAPHYQAGTVSVSRGGKRVAREHVRRNHEYTFVLPPGHCTIQFSNCRDHAQVRADHTTHADVYCMFH